MSKVAEELNKLKELREEELKYKFSLSELIADYEKEKAEYEEKLEILTTKTSELAAKITSQTKRKLNAIKEEISAKEYLKKQSEARLSELENKISEREDDTTLYIQEQCNRMVDEFMKYIKQNANEIGNQIKKTFIIRTVSKKVDDRYGPYYIPTGNIGISDKNEEQSHIVKSEGFCFPNELYTTKRDGYYDNITCYNTEWYNEYFKKFASTLLKTLQENFDSCDFKLTINKSQKTFTLELV